MGDYMFMLENHLSPDQMKVLAEVQAAAGEQGLNVFLTGGALRDMLAGAPIAEIDFTVEGGGIKLAKAVAARSGAEILSTDENRRSAKLRFSHGVQVTISMARQEKFGKPGAKPQVQPATIHEDLRGRDFTINAIALSLNAASRGLLLDPNNGAGDIEHKELRTVTNYTLYDDPVRLLRLQRFKVRLGFTITERTQSQYANAREAGLESKIGPQALLAELRHIANEQNSADLVHLLDEEKLLTLFSPALTGQKVNMAGLHKLQKTRQTISPGPLRPDYMGLFLSVLTEKFTAAEKADLIERLGMDGETVDQWQKLDARAKKLEKELKSARLQKPSHIFGALAKAPCDQIVYLMLRSAERLVQDRIKNYFQKYLPVSQEVTEADVTAAGAPAGSAKFEKTRAQLITARLDARPKKVVPPPVVEEPPAVPPPAVPPRPTHVFARK